MHKRRTSLPRRPLTSNVRKRLSLKLSSVSLRRLVVETVIVVANVVVANVVVANVVDVVMVVVVPRLLLLLSTFRMLLLSLLWVPLLKCCFSLFRKLFVWDHLHVVYKIK